MKNAKPVTKSPEKSEPQSGRRNFSLPEPPKGPGPKILTLDIETAPLQGYFWGLFDQTIGLNQLSKDWYILSYGAKWADGPVFYEDVIDDGFSDERIVRNLRTLLDQADIVVTQNGVKFDIRKIRSRWMFYEIPEPSRFAQVDVQVQNRRLAMHTSQKLQYTAEYVAKSYKDQHANFPGFELWREIIEKRPRAEEARQEMRTYCMQDVEATWEVYLKTRHRIQNHPNVALYYDDDVMRCRVCGSTELEEIGKSYTNVNVYPMYLCKCGAHLRGRFSTTSKAKRRNILV